MLAGTTLCEDCYLHSGGGFETLDVWVYHLLSTLGYFSLSVFFCGTHQLLCWTPSRNIWDLQGGLGAKNSLASCWILAFPWTSLPDCRKLILVNNAFIQPSSSTLQASYASSKSRSRVGTTRGEGSQKQKLYILPSCSRKLSAQIHTLLSILHQYKEDALSEFRDTFQPGENT